ncbi:MAG: hypothetical protein HLUCCA04_02775 [Oceanicaulis sp. HLUCCA04]|nr:MAG: hypothetical protein HLUCCA04_02775 [Oceanicaulis sp. HLUCCA04]
MKPMIRGCASACVLLTGMAAGACASTGPGQAVMEAGVETPAVDCSRYAQSDAPPVFHAMDPNVASILPTARIAVPAGVSIPISVGNFDPPYTIRPIPLPCMDWQVRPDDAARITQDGSVIEIPEAARPGSEILLTGTIRGAEGEAGSQTLRILIIDEITRQLIGTWSFDAVRGCDATQVDAPLEIRFEANNGLSVTWTPFERYWDYWGRYEWSPDSGDFGFEATGGNQVPADISANGQLVLEGDRHLAVSGFHFGTRESGAPSPGISADEAGCTLVFRRQGAGPQ